MSVPEIIMTIMGICVILGSIVSVVVTISNRPTYTHCDETYQRKDLQEQAHKVIIDKMEELGKRFDALQKVVESLKNGK